MKKAGQQSGFILPVLAKAPFRYGSGLLVSAMSRSTDAPSTRIEEAANSPADGSHGIDPPRVPVGLWPSGHGFGAG